MTKAKTFADIAPHYLAERVVSAVYAANVKRVAGKIGTVSVERLNKYIMQRAEQVSGITARSERTIALCMWRWAYDRGLLDIAPRGVLKMKARKRPTKAWTIPQLQALVKATRQYDGKWMRSQADLGQFLRAWVLLAYETGARFGDVMAFRAEHLDGDTISWTQSKTGDPMVRSLTPACLDACDAMLKRSPDTTIVGWACGKREAMRLMRKLLDSQGLGGSSKWLRRSGATHCEMAQPGAGRLHLGHRSPALFESAYADFSQLRTKTPKTPPLV
jgi:integrase